MKTALGRIATLAMLCFGGMPASAQLSDDLTSALKDPDWSKISRVEAEEDNPGFDLLVDARRIRRLGDSDDYSALLLFIYIDHEQAGANAHVTDTVINCKQQASSIFKTHYFKITGNVMSLKDTRKVNGSMKPWSPWFRSHAQQICYYIKVSGR